MSRRLVKDGVAQDSAATLFGPMVFGSHVKLSSCFERKSPVAENDEWEAASEAGRV
jgi:hypothetical protein